MMIAQRVVIAILLALGPAAAHAEIGRAVAITASVTGDAKGAARPLERGARVFQDESIRTNATGIGQFEFLDRSRLAVGPGSTVKLDRFVFDANRGAKSAVIELGRGAFRFISGRSDPQAYSIRTTAAVIGVRGTSFDLYVTGSGALCLAPLSGSVRVCPPGRACRTHNRVGQYLIVTPDRSFWLLDHWDGALLGGVSFAAAMPFLANQGRLAPALRVPQAAVSRYPAP